MEKLFLEKSAQNVIREDSPSQNNMFSIHLLTFSTISSSHILRMMEFEREKRLLERAKRKGTLLQHKEEQAAMG